MKNEIKNLTPITKVTPTSIINEEIKESIESIEGLTYVLNSDLYMDLGLDKDTLIQNINDKKTEVNRLNRLNRLKELTC